MYYDDVAKHLYKAPFTNKTASEAGTNKLKTDYQTKAYWIIHLKSNGIILLAETEQAEPNN